MWLVYSWGRFIPCWKRGKRSTDVIQQCLLIKVCQCACSFTSQGLPVGGAGLLSVAQLRETPTPITHFPNSFSIMFSMSLGQMCVMKKIQEFTVSCFQIYPFLLTYEETNTVCVLQNLLAFVWRSLYESMDCCYLTFSRCCFLSLSTCCSAVDPRGSDYLSCL